MGVPGFDAAPFAGLASIVALVILNLLQSRSWKSKYEQERETSSALRLTNQDMRNDKEDLIKHIHWQKSEIARLTNTCHELTQKIQSICGDSGCP